MSSEGCILEVKGTDPVFQADEPLLREAQSEPEYITRVEVDAYIGVIDFPKQVLPGSNREGEASLHLFQTDGMLPGDRSISYNTMRG